MERLDASVREQPVEGRGQARGRRVEVRRIKGARLYSPLLDEPLHVQAVPWLPSHWRRLNGSFHERGVALALGPALGQRGRLGHCS